MAVFLTSDDLQLRWCALHTRAPRGAAVGARGAPAAAPLGRPRSHSPHPPRAQEVVAMVQDSDDGCDGVKVKVGGCCCCTVLIASAIMVGCSFGVLDPTQFALDYDTVNFQIADGVLYTGGRHFIGLGHQFIIFPNTLQTVRMGSVSAGEGSDGETVKTSSLLARTEDGLQVTLDISFQYRLTADLEQIIKLYSDFQDNYRPAYVRIARNVLRDVASEFQAFQYFYNRTVVGAKMREVLNQALANHSAIVQAFQLLNVELPTRFSSAIEGTEVARQAIENARYQQDVARTEANTRVEEAKRQALIIALEANATAQSTTLQARGPCLHTCTCM